jgi:hypothetical protein
MVLLMPRRETFFECVLVVERNEYRFHMRAWTATEAGQLLHRELQQVGVHECGELRVSDRKGSVLYRCSYQPGEHQPDA